jgi:hypothetical protein
MFSTAFIQTELNNQDAAIQRAAGHAIDGIAILVQRKFPSELEQAQIKKINKETELCKEQEKNQKSARIRNNFQMHCDACGPLVSNWDKNANTFQDTPCGRAWKKWLPIVEKLADEEDDEAKESSK